MTTVPSGIVTTYQQLSVAIHEARLSQATSMLSIAVFAAFLCNVVATIKDEVEVVWSSKRTIGSVMYFITRYLAVVSLSINTIQILIRVFQCGGHQVSISDVQGGDGTLLTLAENPLGPSIVPCATGLIVLCTSGILLQLRTSALYGNPRCLYIAFGILDVFLIVIFAVLARLFRLIPLGQSFTPVAWIPLAFAELVTLSITIWKTWTSYRSAYGTKIRVPLLVKVFIRDNIIYFMIILVLYIVGIVILFEIPEAENAHFEASVAASGAIAPWLYIHLRKTQMMPPPDATIPTMQFEMRSTERESTDYDSTERRNSPYDV